MIIVTGSIVARPECSDELRAISIEHVQRSRAEPGCLSHDVHIDLENPLRLVFFETWADRDALATHFAVPASIAFVQIARRLAAGPPDIRIYQSSRVTL